MNEAAAESDYMKHLEEIRSDTADLAQVPGQETSREIRTQGRRLWKVIVITAIILAAAAGLVITLERLTDRDVDQKAEYIWQQETYPKMDQAYDSKDYDALMDYYAEASQKGYSFYTWDHEDFLFLYADCADLDRMKEMRESSEKGYELVFYDEINILARYYAGSLDQEEKDRLAPYLRKVEVDFDSYYKLPEAQKKKFIRRYKKDGYLNYKKTVKFAKEWRKR